MTRRRQWNPIKVVINNVHSSLNQSYFLNELEVGEIDMMRYAYLGVSMDDVLIHKIDPSLVLLKEIMVFKLLMGSQVSVYMELCLDYVPQESRYMSYYSHSKISSQFLSEIFFIFPGIKRANL